MTESEFSKHYPNTHKYYNNLGCMEFASHRDFFKYKGWSVKIMYEEIIGTKEIINIRYVIESRDWYGDSSFVYKGSPKDKIYESIDQATIEAETTMYNDMENITKSILDSQ